MSRRAVCRHLRRLVLVLLLLRCSPCVLEGLLGLGGLTGLTIYELALRQRWQKSYLEMRVVDATVNAPRAVQERAHLLTSACSEQRVISEGWRRLYGTAAAPEWRYVSEALRIAGEEEGLVIDGRACEEDLADLLARRWVESGGVVSDARARLAWETCIQEVENQASLDGTYTFEYRSYTNEEELNAMLAAQPSLQQLLLRPANRTSLEVRAGEATLEDNFLVLGGLVQAKIRWHGHVAGRVLHWTSSEAVLSSPLLPFQRTIDRPKPAERLRQDPWQILAVLNVTLQGQRRPLAVLNRQGAGKLVFMQTPVDPRSPT